MKTPWISVSPEPSELLAAGDYLWFQARPDRILRLRRATEGDPEGVGPEHVVFVFCPMSGLRMNDAITMPPEVCDALMAKDTDAALAPHFANYLDELVKDQDVTPQGQRCRQRWKKLFRIAREHGRLLALPSRKVLDAP